MKETTTTTDEAAAAAAPAQSSGFGVITPVVKVKYDCPILPDPAATANHCYRHMVAGVR